MTTLTVPEAVRLCTAWADRLARDHEVRALVIKGHVLAAQGLREGYESMDVDLLVDPGDYDRFLELLVAHDWTPMTTSTAPTIIDSHSLTLIHPRWPTTMDVHHYFPGFLADPQAVFDVLWQRRASARVAGVEVLGPDVVGHAALVALHHLRDPDSDRSKRDLPRLMERIHAAMSAAQVVELADVAAQTGASSTLAPVLEALGAPRRTSDTNESEALAAWRLRTAVPESAWLVGLSRLPVWRWPLEIWHAVWLSDEEIATYHRRGGESLARARLRRLLRGFRVVPAAARALTTHRLRRTSR